MTAVFCWKYAWIAALLGYRRLATSSGVTKLPFCSSRYEWALQSTIAPKARSAGIVSCTVTETGARDVAAASGVWPATATAFV